MQRIEFLQIVRPSGISILRFVSPASGILHTPCVFTALFVYWIDELIDGWVGVVWCGGWMYGWLQVDKSRSRELQQLFAKGLGAHHAGMLRPDRSLTEQVSYAPCLHVLHLCTPCSHVLHLCAPCSHVLHLCTPCSHVPHLCTPCSHATHLCTHYYR